MKVYLLGTGAAISDPHRTTTMLAIQEASDLLVIDCGGDVVQRMRQCGLDPLDLSALFLTHEHPDHVSGFPLFVEKIWLHQHPGPIPLIGIKEALQQAKDSFATYNTAHWPLPELEWHTVPLAPRTNAWTGTHLDVTIGPAEHSVPSVALRVTSRISQRTVVYSCDTAPSEDVADLARGADVLIHEANGSFPGHSTMLEAAALAQKANVGRLVLVHVPPEDQRGDLNEARTVFSNTSIGDDLDVLEV